MRETASAGRSMPAWIDPAARAGHAAKGVVYAAVGGVALWRSAAGGEAAGGREALRAMAGAPIGKALVAILAVGLAAYVLWRLSQVALPPEGDGWGRRGLYLLSAAIHLALALFAVELLAGGGAGDPEEASRLSAILERPRGSWIVGGVGVALLVRGALRLARPRGDRFGEGIRSLELPGASRRRVASISRIAVTARGIVLLTIGGTLVQAAAVGAPVGGAPTRTALMGTCLFALALLEWTRARYPLPDA